jgi:uncharacterized membrane protein
MAKAKGEKQEDREVLRHRTRWYSGYYGGVLLLVLGIYFLLLNFGFISFDLGKLWPLFLIVPGLYILFGGKQR